ncbi:MAG TPA: hypothetical protein VK714_23500 [Myxococcota bacterium]|nr:hypothetical protein [Myxococcota bacterium]
MRSLRLTLGSCRSPVRSLFAVIAVAILSVAAAISALPATARGEDHIFVAGNGIGEYTTSGETVNASLLPVGIAWSVAVSGSALFVGSKPGVTGTIGEYTTSGETVNASLITGLPSQPWSIAVSGGNLFVASTSGVTGTIGEYTTSGETVNASLITGLDVSGVRGFGGIFIAVSGSNLFVTNFGGDSIGEYTTSGATVRVIT